MCKKKKTNTIQSFEFRIKSHFNTKEAIRICISKKNRHHNGQKKKYKKTNNGLENMHIKLKIE